MRAVAILGVFFFHLGLFPLGGGYLGVDIFFVISGFLISTLLFAEGQATGTISLSAFYLRRARRILPVLFAVLAATFVPVYLLIATSPAFHTYLGSILAAAFSVSNIFFWLHSGYFALEAVQNPLLHTWTLGLEEQFYLVIPLLIWLFSSRRWKKSVQLVVFIMLCMASYLVCRYGRHWADNDFLFYMLPTRMWELLIGVIASMVVERWDPASKINAKLCDVISLFCVVFLLIIFAVLGKTSYFAENALYATIAAACVIVFSMRGKMTRALLGAPPVRFIGTISYSMYLWHWPIIVITFFLCVKFDMVNSPALKILLIPVILALSVFSWRFIERPLRAKTTWRDLTGPLGVYASLVLLVVGFGWFQLHNIRSPYVPRIDFPPTTRSIEQLQRGELCHLGARNGPETFFLIGDSHANRVSSVLDAMARERGLAGVAATSPATIPTTAMSWNDSKGTIIARDWLDLIAKKEIKNVVIACRWDLLTYEKYYSDGKLLRRNEVIPLFLRSFSATLRELLSHGCDIWIVEQVPRWNVDPVMAVNLKSGNYSERPDRGIRGKLFTNLDADVRDDPRLHMLIPWDDLVTNGALNAIQNGHLLYADTSHLTVYGAADLTRCFAPLFATLETERSGMNAGQGALPRKVVLSASPAGKRQGGST